MTAQLFRKKHLLELLESYEMGKVPIDYHVSSYFRAHKALGSKDRAFIAEEVYRLIRWMDLIGYFCKTGKWQERIEWVEKHDVKKYIENEAIPVHIRVSFPEELYQALVRTWGEKKALEIAVASNEPAPTSIRINCLKTDRETLFKRFVEAGFAVTKGQEAETALHFNKKCNFFTLPEFKEGLFEVQDEASQIVAQMVHPELHERVLDFCAGSGGKTLGIAPYLQGTGQIYLHDVRLHALQEAKKRLKRAGIQNAQIVHSKDLLRLKKLKKQMDWVLVDAPCSGTGTLRRNPDMKYKFSNETLLRLVSEQRVIFEQGLSYVKPNGMIVYATCSILREENEEQVNHFLKTYPLRTVGTPFQSIPEPHKKDGFFAVQFCKIGSI